MKARIVRAENTLYLQYASGMTREVSRGTARDFLLHPDSFLEDNELTQNTEDITILPETDLAVLFFIDDTDRLIIQDIPFFRDLYDQTVEYLTVDEYAELHGKQRSIIVRICREGRLPGAEKKGKSWLIPKDTPYPKDGRFGARLKTI